jgi:hypothetical protein
VSCFRQSENGESPEVGRHRLRGPIQDNTIDLDELEGGDQLAAAVARIDRKD